MCALNKIALLKIIQSSIKGLSTKKKKKGKKVGKLKFKSECKSIDLSHYGSTHKIISKNKIKINGIKRPLVIRGLNQITPEMEIVNAKLLNKPDGYYLKLTTFIFPKGEIQQKKKQDVGLDFGISRNITTSEGEFFNVSIPETERLKKLQRNFARRKKSSKNWFKTKNLIQREYQNVTNKKKDRANKIVNYLSSNYNHVVIQDENLQGWHKGLFGKQVQHSCMGLIKAKLINSKQCVVIDRYLPTTKMCYNCNEINDLKLSDRIFKCKKCNHEEDRDIKSAKTILKLGTIKIGAEYTKFKPAEKQTTLVEDLFSIESHTSLKQDALRN